MSEAQAVPRKKSNGVNIIPAEYQEKLRTRLRQVREGQGIMKSNVRAISPGTLLGYENRDMSSLRLGDLWALSYEYGWSMAEMMMYLIGNEDMPISAEGKNARRMAVYLRVLSPENQLLACELLRSLVDFQAERSGTPSAIGTEAGASASVIRGERARESRNT